MVCAGSPLPGTDRGYRTAFSVSLRPQNDPSPAGGAVVVGVVSIQDAVSLFFFQAEDGIRDLTVTGVQTCALPISVSSRPCGSLRVVNGLMITVGSVGPMKPSSWYTGSANASRFVTLAPRQTGAEIGRASCRERV